MSQHVQFEVASSEGLPIRGVLDVPETPVALVVTIHGFKGFKDWGFFPWTSESFVESHIAACRFDMSRNGVSASGDAFDRLDLFADDTYSQELSDLDDVVRHLETLDSVRHLPIFLFGHSRGGAIALLGARLVPGLRGIVTWSAISSLHRWDAATVDRWRYEGFMDFENSRTKQTMRVSRRLIDDLEANGDALDLRAALGTLTVPLLVVHGSNDESVPVEEATVIASAAHNASMVVIESGTHTYGATHPLVHVPKELRLAMAVTKRFVHTWTVIRHVEE